MAEALVNRMKGSAAQQPDAIIVIFGAAVRPDGRPSGTLRRRTQAAVLHARQFARPLFIPTGAKGRYGEAEAAVMAGLLLESGIPAESIRQEKTGTDTLSSCLAVTAMLRSLPSVPVYACSSAYHLPRCVLLLRLAGIRANRARPPPVPAATTWRKRWYWRLREVPALPYDAVLVLWHRALGRV